MLPEMTDLYTEILDYSKMNFDRQQLIENYAHQVVEEMDLDTLIDFAYSTIVERLETVDDVSLVEEVRHFYPELVEELEPV